MTKRFPGFIDIHVHLREPGATHKEDFYSGSRAAVAGGFTFIIDMPNNPTPTFSIEALQEKKRLRDQKAVCDIGFHYGTDGNNLESFREAMVDAAVFGLKIYCNETTGKFTVSDKESLENIFTAWNSSKPILVHAEGAMLSLVLPMAKQFDRWLHVCHVATADDVQKIREEKAIYQKISAGVCPHHLFLTMKDEALLGGLARMKPELESAQDQSALWEAIGDGTIDIVESDHAPHTLEEKQTEPPAFGVPGLETTLGLLFRGVMEEKIKLEMVETLLYSNPKKIFAIFDQPETYVECDPAELYKIGENGFQSKCGWSPFTGWDAYGRISTVVVRGKTVVKNGSLCV